MDKLFACLLTFVLLNSSAVDAESSNQLVNITAPNTVVIASVGNISFVCDLDGEPAMYWQLNGQSLSGLNGTLIVSTDKLYNDTAVNHLQCSSDDFTMNKTILLVISELQRQVTIINAPVCSSSISPTRSWSSGTVCRGNSVTTSNILQQTVVTPSIINTPTVNKPTTDTPTQPPCVSALCTVRTVPYIATAAIGGSAVVVVVFLVIARVCSCCRHRCGITRRNKHPITSAVVVNPSAWERPVELSPFELSQATFNFNTK